MRRLPHLAAHLPARTPTPASAIAAEIRPLCSQCSAAPFPNHHQQPRSSAIRRCTPRWHAHPMPPSVLPCVGGEQGQEIPAGHGDVPVQRVTLAPPLMPHHAQIVDLIPPSAARVLAIRADQRNRPQRCCLTDCLVYPFGEGQGSAVLDLDYQAGDAGDVAAVAAAAHDPPFGVGPAVFLQAADHEGLSQRTLLHLIPSSRSRSAAIPPTMAPTYATREPSSDRYLSARPVGNINSLWIGCPDDGHTVTAERCRPPIGWASDWSRPTPAQHCRLYVRRRRRLADHDFAAHPRQQLII